MNTATEIKRLKDWRGDARVYRLSKPLEGFSHVVVSAANVPFSGPETFIFGGTNEKGEVEWKELTGSFKGDLDHARALRDAGYESILMKGR